MMNPVAPTREACGSALTPLDRRIRKGQRPTSNYLTANGSVLQQPAVRKIAGRHGKTVPQVVFRFSQALGMIPLTGTTDPDHMRQDLEIYDFDLTAEEVRTIATSSMG